MNVLKWLGGAVIYLLCGIAGTVLVMAMLDPACGSDGNSQKAWLRELQRDVVAAFTK